MNKTQLRKGIGPIEKLLPPRGFYLLKKPDVIVREGDMLSMGRGWERAWGAVGQTVGYMCGPSGGVPWVTARRREAPKAKPARKPARKVFGSVPVPPRMPHFVRVSVQDKIREGDLVADGNIYANGGYWERAHAFVGKSCLELSCNGRTVWACRCVQGGAR